MTRLRPATPGGGEGSTRDESSCDLSGAVSGRPGPLPGATDVVGLQRFGGRPEKPGAFFRERLRPFHTLALGSAQPAGQKRMILYLVRHGQTAHNRDGLGLGRDDVPLTPLGELQVSALGRRLAGVPLDRVFSSPLGRARQTAEAVIGGRGLPIEIREELTEMDVGECEGLTFSEMQKRFPGFLAAWRSESSAAVRMPGGESIADVAERLDPFLAELRESSVESVAVVSHNFVLKVILCRLLELDLLKFRGLTVDVASLTTVSLRNGRVYVRALNDSCHLVPLEP